MTVSFGELISNEASHVLDRGTDREFEAYLVKCDENHWHHHRIGITMHSIDLVRSARFSLLQGKMPFITRLEIKTEVSTDLLNHFFNSCPFLTFCSVAASSPLNLRDVVWPAKLQAITFSYPSK